MMDFCIPTATTMGEYHAGPVFVSNMLATFTLQSQPNQLRA
jgi:hypothetical protein